MDEGDEQSPVTGETWLVGVYAVVFALLMVFALAMSFFYAF